MKESPGWVAVFHIRKPTLHNCFWKCGMTSWMGADSLNRWAWRPKEAQRVWGKNILVSAIDSICRRFPLTALTKPDMFFEYAGMIYWPAHMLLLCNRNICSFPLWVSPCVNVPGRKTNYFFLLCPLFFLISQSFSPTFNSHIFFLILFSWAHLSLTFMSASLHTLILLLSSSYSLHSSFNSYIRSHPSSSPRLSRVPSSTEPWEGNGAPLCGSVRTLWGGFGAASGADRPHHEEQPAGDASGPGSAVRTTAGQWEGPKPGYGRNLWPLIEVCIV